MVHAQYNGYGSPLNLPEKISDVNPQKDAIVREKIEQDVAAPPNDHKPHFLRRIGRSAITLPPLSVYPAELQTFLYRDVIDHTILLAFVHSAILNWCQAAKQLLPIQTTADGNCLLHAISLGVWGVEDDRLTLRRLLYRALTDNVEFVADMKRRWESERKKVDSVLAGELRYKSEQWNEEWTTMIRIAEPSRRPAAEDGLPYQCLDEFHIFVMANILRRPIIVAAENMWRGIDGHSLQPQNFGGIYLPLCWEPKDCSKTPVILAYHAMHFTPLIFQNPGTIGDFVSMTANAEYAFPIVKQDLTPMVVHFLLDHEERNVMALLPSYLEIKELDYRGEGGLQKIQAAMAKPQPLPEEMDLIRDYFQKAESQYHRYLDREFGDDLSVPAPQVPQDKKKAARKCQMEHCQNVGDYDNTLGICDTCMTRLQEQSMGPAVGQVSMHGSPIGSPATPPPNPGPAPIRAQLPSYDDAVRHGNAGKEPGGKPAGHYIPSILPIKCSNQNCEYFCAITTGKYCHTCCLMLPQPRSEPGGVICATENCMNLGNHLTDNLCKVCYDQKWYNRQASASARPTAPPPSIISQASEAGAARASSTSAPLKMPSEPKRASSSSSSPVHGAAMTFIVPEDERRSNSLPMSFNGVHGPQKCLMPDCKHTGYPQLQGLCEGCYNQQAEVFEEIKKNKQAQPVKPASALSDPIVAEPQVKPKQRAMSEGGRGNLCLTRGCDMFGSVYTKGYCSQCYGYLLAHSAPGAGKSHTGNTVTAVLKPEPNFRMAHKMKKCKTPDCQRVGFHSNSDYCNECFGIAIATGARAQGAEAAPAAAAAAGGGAEQAGQKQPTKFKVQKHICVNPGCEGVRIVSDAAGGLCYWCHDKATRNIVREPEVLQEREDVREEEIPLAAPNNGTPAGERCANPNCDHPAISADLKLCQRCFNVLDAAKMPLPPNRPEEKKQKTGKMHHAHVPCATAECPNNRDPGRQGFCKTCYHKYLEGGSQPPVQRPVPGPGEGLPPKVNRPKCQAPWGCDMFGDPDHKNLCSKCFQRSLVEKYKHAAPAGPAQYGPYKPNYVVLAYDEPWGYRHQECATVGCTNEGNMNILDGLCDECYHVYQDIRQVPKYALLRELRAEPAPAPKAERPSCRFPACDHFGNPKCFGYCNECYEVLMVNAPDQLVPDRLNQMQI